MANIIVNLAKAISYLGRVIKSRYIFSKGLTKIDPSKKLKKKRFLLNFFIGCKTITTLPVEKAAQSSNFFMGELL